MKERKGFYIQDRNMVQRPKQHNLQQQKDHTSLKKKEKKREKERRKETSVFICEELGLLHVSGNCNSGGNGQTPQTERKTSQGRCSGLHKKRRV
jgi:hypothetical protein